MSRVCACIKWKILPNFNLFLQFILRIKGEFAQEYWYLPFFSSFFVKIPPKWLILWKRKCILKLIRCNAVKGKTMAQYFMIGGFALLIGLFFKFVLTSEDPVKKIEYLWQPWAKQVYLHHFCNNICSLHISVTF